MTFSTLKTRLKALPCGKRLNHSVYIIEDSLTKVYKLHFMNVMDLKTKVGAVVEYNVTKIFNYKF